MNRNRWSGTRASTADGDETYDPACLKGRASYKSRTVIFLHSGAARHCVSLTTPVLVIQHNLSAAPPQRGFFVVQILPDHGNKSSLDNVPPAMAALPTIRRRRWGSGRTWSQSVAYLSTQSNRAVPDDVVPDPCALPTYVAYTVRKRGQGSRQPKRLRVVYSGVDRDGRSRLPNVYPR